MPINIPNTDFENITEPSYHNLWALQVDNKDGEATVKGRPGWVESMDWSDGQAAMTFSHHQAWPSFISNSLLWKARNDPTHLLSQWWHTFLNQTADLCVCMSGRFFRHIGVRDHIWAKLPKSGKYRKSKVWDKKTLTVWGRTFLDTWCRRTFLIQNCYRKIWGTIWPFICIEVNQEPHVASCVKISRVTL